MSGAAHNLGQEFWRPPAQKAVAPAAVTETCSRCATQFVTGARFCHVCGADRSPEPAVEAAGFTRYLDFALIRDALGLTTAALIAFVIGIACVIAAIAVGFMYTASTVLDWQAVQIWRIEWLLAATVAFVAGILLKNRN